MNSATQLNTSELMMGSVYIGDSAHISSLSLSTSNDFPAMETSIIATPDLLGVTQDPDILAMCNNSVKPIGLVNGGGDMSEVIMSSNRNGTAPVEENLAATNTECFSEAIANDWEMLTSDMSLQAETLPGLELPGNKELPKHHQQLNQVLGETIQSRDMLIDPAVHVFNTKALFDRVEESQSELHIHEAPEVIGAERERLVAIDEEKQEDLDLFVEDCGVNDVNTTIKPQLSKMDDIESAPFQVEDTARNQIKPTVNTKGRSSKDTKLAATLPELNVNSRPKRSTPRRSVFELLQGDIQTEPRSMPSVTTKRRNSGSSVEEDKLASKSIQLFSGYGSSDEDKPNKKQRKHASSGGGVSRCRVPRRPNFDYGVEPVYSADDFGEFNMEIVAEPTLASDLNKPTGAALFSFGSAMDTGNQSESLWSAPRDAKNSPSIAEPASLDKIDVNPAIEPNFEDQVFGSNEGNIAINDNTDLPVIEQTDMALIDNQEIPINDNQEIPLIDKFFNRTESSTVSWLTATMEKDALRDDTTDITPSLDKTTTVDNELKEKQKPSSNIVQPMKKFNIDPHTRKFIRVRDTTGCSSSAGRMPGPSSMGGISEGEKEIKRLAVILKTKEAKLNALDRELDARVVTIKLIESRVNRRERALKDAAKSLEYRERMLRVAETEARAKREELNSKAVESVTSENKDVSSVESRFDTEASLGGIHAASIVEKQEELDRLRQRLIDERESILSNEQRLSRWEAELQQRQNDFEEKKKNIKKSSMHEGGEDAQKKGGAFHHKSQRSESAHSKSLVSVHKQVSKLVSKAVSNGVLSKNKSKSATLLPGKKRRIDTKSDLIMKKSTSSKVDKTR